MNNLITNDVLPQDFAMDAFRSQFPLMCGDVSTDGLRMTYRMNQPERFMPIARCVIDTMQLPLSAKIDRVGLVIEFVGVETPLTCY